MFGTVLRVQVTQSTSVAAAPLCDQQSHGHANKELQSVQEMLRTHEKQWPILPNGVKKKKKKKGFREEPGRGDMKDKQGMVGDF